MNKKSSIVTQTAVRVSAVFVVALIVLVLSFTWFIGTYMRNHILENQQEQMELVTDSVSGKMDGLMEMAVSLANYQPTTALLGEYYEKYSPNWMENIRNLDNYLQNVNLFTEYIVDINLIHPDSETLYSLRNTLRSNYPYTEQKWFQETLEKESLVKYAPPHGEEHLYRTNLRDTISLIYPVFRSDKLMGYELIECTLKDFLDFPAGTGTQGSNYLLLDEQDKIIFGEEEELSSGLLSALHTEDSGIYQENGSIYLISRLTGNGWTLILESDQGILWKPIKRLALIVIILALVTAVLLFLINVYNVKVMAKPFHALINRINSYNGSGAETLEEYEDAPKELAIIGEQFEQMAGKVNSLINEVYVAQLKQRDAELEALINQINPHFLYNVFQLIQTKAVLSDNQEIEDMIQALSMMMRYTMERKRDQVRVSEELDYIRNYLMFYQERFPKLFTYEICGEEAVSEYRVIKFILQPVLENCFKHGFKDRKEGGIIKIAITETKQDLIFSVRDNGCGISEERLSQIQKKLDGFLDEGGIGIVNTNARIRLVYGYPYGIRIESRQYEFTNVILTVKKVQE